VRYIGCDCGSPEWLNSEQLRLATDERAGSGRQDKAPVAAEMVVFGLIAIAGGIFGLRTRDRSSGSVAHFLFGNRIDDQKREAWKRRFERADAVLSWLFIGAGALLVAGGIATDNWVES
jgi:hypothetical protein